MRSSTRVLTALLLSMILVVGSIFIAAELIRAVKGESGSIANAWRVAAPAFEFVFVYGLMRFGRWLARNEQKFLTDFLCTTLEAHRMSTSDRMPTAL
jgi:hypothetical protein